MIDVVFELWASKERLACVPLPVPPPVGSMVIIADKNYRVRSHIWEVVPPRGAFVHVALTEWSVA